MLTARERPQLHHPEETLQKHHPHLQQKKHPLPLRVHPQSTPLDFKLSNQHHQHTHTVLHPSEEEGEEGDLLLLPLLPGVEGGSVGMLVLQEKIKWLLLVE
jgi:hypothetical protein